MLKLADRVKETSITVGSGLEIALAGAFGAFQTFSSTIGNGNSTYYTIENNSNFEVGVGTYSASNNTLSRDLVLSSTNNNQRISLDGVSIVFCCYPASQAVFLQNGYISALSPQYSGILFPDTTVIDTAFLSGVVPNTSLPTGLVYTNDSRLSDTRVPKSHTHSISEINSLQSSLDGKQIAGSYAASSHSHTSSQITDFNSSVSGLLQVKNISGSGYVNVISTTGNHTIFVTGLQPSGNYSLIGHSHIVSDVSGLQIVLDGKQPSGSYAALTHTHVISDVSGLQSSLDSKQPSGSYAALSHAHLSSDITNFNSSVSGLINGIYAPLSSPTLTGVPLAPTASSGTNTNQIASTSFVRTEISNLVASAPSTLDTLNELATALGNDPNFATTITNSLANKAALAGAIFTGAISSPSGSFASSLKVNNTDVSLNGHGHSISDISGLQTSLDSKQPSGSYANLSHTHLIADVSGLQTSLDSKQPSGNYASSSHSHIISDVSGLQLALDSKQPSGNYAASSHTHTSSNITDFNSSVSGILPVIDIIAGTNITVSPVSGIYTINSTASGGATQILSYATTASFPATGSTNSYYFASDSSRLYQWTGSYYAEIGPPISSVNNAQNAANLYMWNNFK
jgi:hypothetical protein